MNAYRELIRRKLLEDMYERMSDEDKRTFVQLTMQNKSNDETLQALAQQKNQLDHIEKSQNWFVAFGSDIAANFLTDGLIWIGSKLFRKL